MINFKFLKLYKLVKFGEDTDAVISFLKEPHSYRHSCEGEVCRTIVDAWVCWMRINLWLVVIDFNWRTPRYVEVPKDYFHNLNYTVNIRP